MQSYAKQLASQVNHKNREDERVKKEDTRESTTYLYAQQLIESRKQECGECHKAVKEAYLSFN